MATTSEIKARYKFLAKQNHPDKAGDTLIMSEINKAYSILSDPKKRFEYNAMLSRSKETIHSNTSTTGASRSRQTATFARNSTDPPSPAHPDETVPLTFHPFRSVGFVAIFILGLTLLGLLGLVRENNSTTPLDTSGTSNNSPSVALPQSSNAPPTKSPAVSPVQSPSSNASGTTSNSLYGFGSGLVSGAQHFFKDGKTVVGDCTTAGSQILQTESKLEAQISSTEAELSTLSNYRKIHVWWESSSDPSSAYTQLEQQLNEYKSELSTSESSAESC